MKPTDANLDKLNKTDTGGGRGEWGKGKWTGTDAPQAVDMLRVFRFGIMKIVLVVVTLVAVVVVGRE